MILVTGRSLTHELHPRWRDRITATPSIPESTLPTGEHVLETVRVQPDVRSGRWRLTLANVPGVVYGIEDGREVRLLVCDDHADGSTVAWADLPIGVPPEQAPTDPILGIAAVTSDDAGTMTVALTDGRRFPVELPPGPKGDQGDPGPAGLTADERAEVLGAAAVADGAKADAQEAVTLAQQAQAAALEVPDANVSALVGNPATETFQVMRARASILSVLEWGATGDGVTDDTAAWQACVDAAPEGSVITGKGKTFLVTSVNYLKSHLVVEDARFITKGGSGNGRSPVAIGQISSSTVLSGLAFRRVAIDGNRVAQTNLGPSEDGACHGFRILGPVADLVFEDCEARNCASDGMQIFSANTPLASMTTGASRNVWVIRSRFNGNRRHGVAADSIRGLHFIDCELNGNGLNADGSIAPGNPTSGASGAIMPGPGGLYGNGIDVEEYAPDTWAGDISFTRCTMTGNAKGGALFYQGPNRADAAGWAVRTGFTFTDCTIDSGVSAAADGYAVTFTPLYAHRDSGWFYDDIQINSSRILGKISARSTRNVRWDGGVVDPGADTAIALADKVEFMRVGPGLERKGKSVEAANAAVDYGEMPITIHAEHLYPSAGGSELTAVNRVPVVKLLGANGVSWVGAWIAVPADWTRVDVSMTWVALADESGSAAFGVYVSPGADGATLATPAPEAAATDTTTAQHVVQTVRLVSLLSINRRAYIEVVRDAANANDTLTGDIGVVALGITRR